MIHRYQRALFTFGLGAVLFTCCIEAIAANSTLKLQSVVKVKKVLCGLKTGKNQKTFIPVRKSGKKYVLNSSKANKAVCAKLVKGSLKNLPAAKTALGAATTASSGVDAKLSGTPPLLASLPSSDISSIFWRPGVISALTAGTPTAEQCNEFFGGQNDGTSGGEPSCQTAQNVAQTFEQVLQAGTSLCYLRNMPSSRVISSGALKVTEGSVPSGIENLFETPLTGARVIKVSISGFESETQEGEQEGGPENIFIRVNGSSENQAKNLSYGVKLWFCGESEGTPSERETITLSSDNVMVHKSEGGDGQRKGISSVTAKVVASGSSLRFDPSSVRTVSYEGGDSQFSSKSELEINPSGKIIQKMLGSDSFKLYSIANFSGSDLSTVRLLSSGTKNQYGSSSAFSNSSEWRDSYYASFTDQELLTELNQVNFETDSFFSDLSLTDPDLSDTPCNISPDVELTLDMSNSVMQSIATDCEGDRLSDGGFCRSQPLETARRNYDNFCRQN